MAKRLISLTESQIQQAIQETIERYLNEEIGTEPTVQYEQVKDAIFSIFEKNERYTINYKPHPEYLRDETADVQFEIENGIDACFDISVYVRSTYIKGMKGDGYFQPDDPDEAYWTVEYINNIVYYNAEGDPFKVIFTNEQVQSLAELIGEYMTDNY